MSEIFRIYMGVPAAALLGDSGLKQYWRDQVAEQGGTPVEGCAITVRRFGNRVVISGAADRAES